MNKEKTRMKQPTQKRQIELLLRDLAALEERNRALARTNGELEASIINREKHLRALTDIRQRLHGLDEVLVRIGVPLI